MDAALVVMAAGIGSRFGGGIKQLEPMGPNGEIIMDYAIYDARKAGFRKVVFIIRKDLEKDFREIIGNRIEKVMDVDYAFQELEDLPAGFTVPAGRKKPWGTGQAVLAAKNVLHSPFCVINADDYYGPKAFQVIHDYMESGMRTDGGGLDMCMAGFILKNTLSDNGTVTRGVCSVNADGYLDSVTETFEIREQDGVLRAQDAAGQPVHLRPDQFVSMNMWGLPQEFLGVLEEGFPKFLRENGSALKSEYLLPTVVDQCIHSGKGTVRVLPTEDRWFGVTYKEDKPVVVDSIRKLIDAGVYPEKLYG